MVLLEDIVAKSGGRIIGVDSSDDIHSVFVKILDELRSQYAIGYYPSNAADDGSWHDIRVKVLRAGVQPRTHAGYVDH
jgi:VWFA-related protein